MEESNTTETTSPAESAPQEDVSINSALTTAYSDANKNTIVYDKSLVDKLMSYSKEESKPEEKAEAKPEEKPEVKLEAKPELKPAPVLKFTVGDKEVELPEDAKIKVTVNSKEEEVSLADLRRDYQGRIPWSQHYRQLKEDRKAFDNERAAHQHRIQAETAARSTFVTKAKTDPWGALIEQIINAGENPAEFLPAYLAQVKATADHMATLSDADLKTLVQAKQLEFRERVLKNKEAATEALTKAQSETAALIQHIETKKRETGITEEELQNAFKLLSDLDAKPDSPFKFGKMTDIERADAVFEYVQDYERPFIRIGNILKEEAPELLDNNDFIRDLKHTTLDAYENFSDDELRRVIRGVVGKPAAASNGKVQAQPSTDSSTGKPTSSTPGKTPQNVKAGTGNGVLDYRPMSMDDIVRRYRNE